MQPTLGTANMLCFTAILLASCACGLPKPRDGVLDNRTFAAGAAAQIAQATNRTQRNSAAQGEDVDRLKRAAVFRDSGRYYK